MSEFDDFLGTGFAEAATVFGTATLVAQNRREAEVVADVPQLTAALRDAGLVEMNARTLTISRADFDRLALDDRQPVTLGGTAYRVLMIEDADAVSVLTVHLMRNR